MINFTDLIAIRSCTCKKTPTKLVCKCIQAKTDSDQKTFINPTLTKNIINGNFERPISFVHADGAFESNGQFKLRRVDSLTMSSEESNTDLDEEFNNNDEISNNNENCLNDENDNCLDESDDIDDVCLNEDEGFLADDINEDDLDDKNEKDEDDKNEENESSKDKKSKKEKKSTSSIDDTKIQNLEYVTKLIVKGKNSSVDDLIIDKNDNQIRSNDEDKITRIAISKNLNKTSDSLESDELQSDELNCSFEDECLADRVNCLDNQEIKPSNKRRVSILKDHAQSILMTSTSSGISTSSCNSSSLNKSIKNSSQPKILIRCVRIYYSVPYASFNFKIKCINLVPEYLQDNFVITPETIFKSNKISSIFDLNNSTKDVLNAKFKSTELNDSLNTLNSLPTESDQQRINMISLMNATSQNRILEQKKIKQFAAFVKNHLQGK